MATKRRSDEIKSPPPKRVAVDLEEDLYVRDTAGKYQLGPYEWYAAHLNASYEQLQELTTQAREADEAVTKAKQETADAVDVFKLAAVASVAHAKVTSQTEYITNIVRRTVQFAVKDDRFAITPPVSTSALAAALRAAMEPDLNRRVALCIELFELGGRTVQQYHRIPIQDAIHYTVESSK